MGYLVSSCVTSILPSKIIILEIVPSYFFISVVTNIYTYISDLELGASNEMKHEIVVSLNLGYLVQYVLSSSIHLSANSVILFICTAE